ncbi:CUB domain-containing protein 1 isoform X1 [Nothobranchius furzeri]|uniref:Transcript variant X1 n=1 Tax=Nothobranchius furzeri TaxID=105023 RepID=A0A8C6NVQ0_NOTFU|nr:transcript variant X1 [Nothobranchius furzeri]
MTCFCGTRALLVLLFLSSLSSTESLQTVVPPCSGCTVTVSTTLTLDECSVCTVSGVNDTQTSCSSSVTLVPVQEVKLLFKCSQPIEQSFTVTVDSSVECTGGTCNPSTVEAPASILQQFSRTFTWEVKVPEKTLVKLNVLGEGLIETSQPCPDGLRYTVATSKTNIKNWTHYCRGGTENVLKLLNQAVVSLEAQPKTKVQLVLFQATAEAFVRPKMVVTIGPSSTVVLSRDQGEPECDVCVCGGPAPDCSSSEKTLKSPGDLEVDFGCLKPQEVFTMKMTTKIACTTSSCTPAVANVDPTLFKDFKRTLMWDISVPERTVLSLDFGPSYGLKDISTTDNCQDGYKYTVSTSRFDGTIQTNSYCKDGKVSQLELLGATTVTLELPTGGDLDRTVFNVNTTPRRGRQESVTSDPNTMIFISRVAQEPDCSVCVNEGSGQNCNPQSLSLTDPSNTIVEFTCPLPQDVFSVEINRQIDCTKSSCVGDTVHAESTFFPDFNRTFTWDLKVNSPKTFQLDFPEPGMRQVQKEELCPDGHTYSLIAYPRTGFADIGTFCQGGPVNTVQVRYKGRMSLRVPGNAKLGPANFKLDVGPETRMLAIMKVSLPRGVSDTDFSTPYFPRKFPDLQQMQWDFTVPGMHNYTILFHNYTAPECLTGDVAVEYQKGESKVTTLTLTDPQPQHQQGDFSMVLKNCETNTTLQGLSLSYRVSVMRSGHPVLCTVDLTKQQGVSLQIEKVGSDPYCEISLNSEVKEKMNVLEGTTARLSFLDCTKDDLRLTARQVFDCPNAASCPPFSLTIPSLDSCLPMPLSSFTWLLRIPSDQSLDLVSPSGSLQQALPGQECQKDFLLNVAEADGYSVGDFCLNGNIQKVQVHANITVTATTPDFSKVREPFLNVSIGPEISETFIYSIDPTMTILTLLATPNWPQGMRPFSTASWIVSLPSQYSADIQFANLSQPICAEKHTQIKVKNLDQKAELMSRREDEKIENLMAQQSFQLDMSNCKPKTGDFGAMTKIVLQKKSNLLAILLGLAGVLLLLILLLAAVCVIARKKKQRRKESSIYTTNNIFRPSDRHFTKPSPDNNSYDYIDDSMVYGHMLTDTSYPDRSLDFPKGKQADTYQTFTGPTDVPLPIINEPEPEPEMDMYTPFLDTSESFIPSRPRTPINRQESLGFQDSRMTDNQFCTFKSTGDINTIQLSGEDLKPQPPKSKDYL